jgi:hypothetical protein
MPRPEPSAQILYTYIIGTVTKRHHDLFSDFNHHGQLKLATLALSASSIFQLHLFQRSPHFGSRCTKRASDHNARTFYRYVVTFYKQSLRSLRGLRNRDQVSPYLRLAVKVLLALFEWESGSISAYFVHLNGADAIVVSYHEQLSKTTSGFRLLCLWAELRSQKNSWKLAFRPFEIEVADDRQIQAAGICHHYLGASNSVSGLLAEAFRLRERLVLLTCTTSQLRDTAATLRESGEWYSKMFGYPYDKEMPTEGCRFLSKAETLGRLFTIHQNLQMWQDSLTGLERPVVESIEYQYSILQSLNESLKRIYRKVRAAVPAVDEDVPVNTIRVWVLGTLTTIVMAEFTQIFSMHNPPSTLRIPHLSTQASPLICPTNREKCLSLRILLFWSRI